MQSLSRTDFPFPQSCHQPVFHGRQKSNSFYNAPRWKAPAVEGWLIKSGPPDNQASTLHMLELSRISEG